MSAMTPCQFGHAKATPTLKGPVNWWPGKTKASPLTAVRGKERSGRIAERADNTAVEPREWRAILALTEAAWTASNATRMVRESHESIKRSAENAERRVRERARRKTAGRGARVLVEPNAVVLRLAVAGPPKASPASDLLQPYCNRAGRNAPR